MPAWTPEEAREHARKGGEARAEQRKRERLTPAQRARRALAAKSPDLAQELVDAALGKGTFEDLDPKTRVQALMRALEHGLGRPPAAAKPAEEEKDPPEDPTEAGLSFH